MNIHRLSPEEAKIQAREDLLQFIKQAAPTPLLVLLSGGSWISVLKDASPDFPLSHCTFAVLDERFSRDPAVNNFLQWQETRFFKEAAAKGAAFIESVPAEEESLAQFADRMEAELRSWQAEYAEGLIAASVGVGPDGHVAGILPYPEAPEFFEDLFETTDRWMVGYDAKAKNPQPLRVTATIPFLQSIDHATVFLKGLEKQEALERVLREDGTFSETPARVLSDMKDVDIFTDIPA